MEKDLIDINNLCKSYKNNVVLKNLTYKFYKGNIYCIKGKNGSGKTTLFKILLNLIKYESGTINTDLKISGLIEESNGYKDISVLEQLIYLLNDKSKLNEIKEYAKIFNIEDSLNKSFYKLSLGMKQKVALIYIFLNDSDVILLDEPTISLDSESCLILNDLVLKKKNEGKLVIISSHDSYFLNIFNDSINLNLIDGNLVENIIKDLKEFHITCRNPRFKDFLEEKSINYEQDNTTYKVECYEDIINEIIKEREKYELISIVFK